MSSRAAQGGTKLDRVSPPQPLIICGANYKGELGLWVAKICKMPWGPLSFLLLEILCLGNNITRRLYTVCQLAPQVLHPLVYSLAPSHSQ